MPHQVLECLWIHSRLCHVAAVSVAAGMGRDVRHLHPVDIVVPLDHMVETVFPVHCHQRVAVLIHKKESAVPINHLFKSRRLPVLNDAPKASGNILRHGQLPRPHISLRGFNHQLHVRSLLELVVNVEDFVFQVNIPQSQTAELRNPLPRVEKSDHFIVFAVYIVIMDGL